MKITENPDKEIVKMIREGLAAKDGYCPCRLEKIPENKCMCQEFRQQIADPEFEGFCHCRLYYKSLEETPAGYSVKAASDDLAPVRDDLA